MNFTMRNRGITWREKAGRQITSHYELLTLPKTNEWNLKRFHFPKLEWTPLFEGSQGSQGSTGSSRWFSEGAKETMFPLHYCINQFLQEFCQHLCAFARKLIIGLVPSSQKKEAAIKIFWQTNIASCKILRSSIGVPYEFSFIVHFPASDVGP